MDNKGLIIDVLSKVSGLDKLEIAKLLTTPPSSELGDFAFPCFVLSKTLKKSPSDVAVELTNKISSSLDDVKHFEEIKATGAYINFFMNKKSVSEKVIKEVLKLKGKYGSTKKGKEKVVIEFPSPNTNKPLHLGHLRNMSIGESISRILEFGSKKVVRVNLKNDRGIHICKSMLAYQRWGNGDTPQKSKMKSDHFVGKYYVLYNQKEKEETDSSKGGNGELLLNKNSLGEEIQKMLKSWEDGDKKTLTLWKKMNKWALDGFKETYKLFGIKHDKTYFESKFYNDGKDIVMKGLKDGLFFKKDGAIVADLTSSGLGEKTLLRPDGTSIYITQDLALAQIKMKDYNPNESIHLVGNEQIHHFKVLAELVRILGLKSKVKHLSYGMVNLPDGKMKSREGTVVDADDFINEIKTLVEEEVKSRYSLPDREVKSRSLAIALSAIKYFLLKVGIERDTIYNPKESISFEGNTGPYLQYSYARASSILRKAKKKVTKFKIDKVEVKEYELVKNIGLFSEKLSDSLNNLDPSVIANYSYDLAKSFNDFYNDCPVIGSEQEDFRIALVESFRIVMKNALWLLGIQAIEEM